MPGAASRGAPASVCGRCPLEPRLRPASSQPTRKRCSGPSDQAYVDRLPLMGGPRESLFARARSQGCPRLGRCPHIFRQAPSRFARYSLAYTRHLPAARLRERRRSTAYGADFRVMYQRAADDVDKVLRGAKPGDLPIEQSSQLKLVLNLKTAQVLGLTFPESILQHADEVIR